jgi:general secretion pathway protein G
MHKNRNRKNRGFTILEIMAVVIIIGILASMVAFNVFGKVEDAKKKATQASLRVLDDAVTQFKLDTGRFPTDEEGLKALVEKPSDVTSYPEGGYLKTRTVPKDAWGHEFIYRSNPEKGGPFEVISLGADGQEGGEAGTPNADLSSRDSE